MEFLKIRKRLLPVSLGYKPNPKTPPSNVEGKGEDNFEERAALGRG
jgi:hypothetical protein